MATNASRARPTAEASTKYHAMLSEIWMAASSSVAGSTGVPGRHELRQQRDVEQPDLRVRERGQEAQTERAALRPR